MSESIECPKCKMVSYHLGDIEHKYCANCREYLEDIDLKYASRIENIFLHVKAYVAIGKIPPSYRILIREFEALRGVTKEVDNIFGAPPRFVSIQGNNCLGVELIVVEEIKE